MVRVLLLFFAYLLLNGCATVTTFESTPATDDDFSQPMEQIRAAYSDVALYEQRWRGFDKKSGDLAALENKWGKADRVQTHWGAKLGGMVVNGLIIAYAGLPLTLFAVVETMFMYPTETHHWNKGLYHVGVEVNRNIFSGYEKRVTLWDWSMGQGAAAVSALPMVQSQIEHSLISTGSLTHEQR